MSSPRTPNRSFRHKGAGIDLAEVLGGTRSGSLPQGPPRWPEFRHVPSRPRDQRYGFIVSTFSPSSTPTRPPRVPLPTDLRVGRYDQAAGALVTALIMVGAAAVVLFLIWLMSVLVFRRVPSGIQMIEYPGRGDHAEGFERDPDPPGLEELEIVMDEPQLEAALEPVTDLASQVASSMDLLATDSIATEEGSGRGDNRPPGPLGEGEDVIPPWERWEFQYSSSSIEVYARQLDFFKIELAAAGGARLIDYAYNLSRNPPSRRQGESKEEKRIYFTWKTGRLREFDQQLLERAGIATAGRIIMQLIPEEINEALHALEFENSPGRSPKEWLRTIFGVRPQGNGYEYYIIEQIFRAAPP
jgi:hypothetical protein